MASLPVEYRSISKADLIDKYRSEDWAAHLTKCRFEQLQDEQWAAVLGRREVRSVETAQVFTFGLATNAVLLVGLLTWWLR